MLTTLRMLPCSEYPRADWDDPLRLYYWPFVGDLYRRRVELCLKQCSGGKRILEIGFGSGVTFLDLHEQYAEVHGLDLTASAAAVRAVFARKGVQVYLLNGNALSLPYAGNTFDTVLMISILEHLLPHQLTATFEEVRRVLVPGGQCVRPRARWAVCVRSPC